MSKIIVDRIELKNFFSYGNNWTDVSLESGINVVLGHDKDHERSNGAGKTSFLEAIPFALFGQTSKNISLPKIVNWRNGKNCEVRLHFKKDGIPYILHRGIKPGTLELIKDGVTVPKLSDKRVFQTELEEDLIGMDFKAAQAILFQNANNTISLFNTPKEQKRRFIEKFFNLEIYSKAMEIANKKAGNVSTRLSEINTETTFARQRVTELERTIASFVAPNLDAYEDNIVQAKKRLDDYQVEAGDKLNACLIAGYQEDVELLKSEQLKLESDYRLAMIEVGKVEDELNQLRGEKTTLEKRIVVIGDLTDQKDKLVKVKKALSKGDYNNAEEELKKYIKEVEEIKSDISDIKTERKVLETEYSRVLNELKSWNSKKTADAGICPACFQEVNTEHILEHIKTQVDTYESQKEEIANKLLDVGQRVTDLDKRLYDANQNFQLWTTKVEQKHKFEQALAKLSGVEEKATELSEIEKRIRDIDASVRPKLEVRKGKAQKLVDDVEKQRQANVLTIKEKQDALNVYDTAYTKYKSLEKDVETEERIYNNQKEIHDRVMGEYQANVASKSEFESNIAAFDSEVKKLETMKDYLEHVKFTLKDENVKQYAISGIVPYLQQQTNHYLAETGHNYYVELDNWLDGQIKGFGVGDCDFGNMSGGEGKSIDLALKFAMMDVARRQAGSYLDVLVLDELLDSSIDSFGLEKTMDIVRMKQLEDNLKVFIVSHREEVAGFGPDKIYQVTKQNGMSTIGVIGD